MKLRHSLFDKIFISFLGIFVVIFTVLVLYSTYVSKKTLVEERTEVLTNEAFLIADQTIVGYARGYYTKADLMKNLNYYSQALESSIWVADEKGIVYASAKVEGHPDNPKNVLFINQDFDLTEAQSFNGTFFDFFDDEVITVAIPILTNNEPKGMIFVHSSVPQLRHLQSRMIKLVYLPFLIMIIVSFVLLGIVSGKIMRPIKKINAVAEDYAKGNFESKMEIESDDEIGQLASTLEYMADELSKLDDYRRAFISNISHDFRSPLTSIKGYVEAIRDGTIPPERQDRYLAIIADETQRLTKLTTGLLELNDYDAYGLYLKFKDFDLIDLVLSAINTFEGKCIQKGVAIRLNNHTEDSVVHADQTKIQQVIYNLLDNAIKFTPEGKSIYVTLNEIPEKIFISIKDEGSGIPKKSLNRIWDRFYKADSSRGKDKRGTGLGLAITKEIVKAHGENINVVSTEGVGSEFTFSLVKASALSDKGENKKD